jgi:hypothetical protein
MSKSKPMLIISIFLLSVFIAPNITNAKAQDPMGEITDVTMLNSAMGQMFGMFGEFGASGAVLGTVLQMMLTDFENFTDTGIQEIPGVYMMSASYVQTSASGDVTFGPNDDWYYQPWGVYDIPGSNELPYFKLERSGTLTYSYTEGADVMFIIWDHDGSFIEALDKLVNAVYDFMAIMDSGASSEEQMNKAISLAVETITYFLIHINDIINGDEVIIANVVAFRTFIADFSGVSTTGTWYYTESYGKTDTQLLSSIYPGYATDFAITAAIYNDQSMLSILNNDWDISGVQTFTDFSMDLIEIWLKNFEIHIDVAAIVDAINGAVQGSEDPLGTATLTDIFDGLDIEFYIFTHHFSDWYFFDDYKLGGAADGNGVPDVMWTDLGTTSGGIPVKVINDTEATDRLILTNVNWTFDAPTVSNGELRWGLTGGDKTSDLDNVDFRIIPLGMKAEDVSEVARPTHSMDYLKLGFSFAPTVDQTVQLADFGLSEGGEDVVGLAKVKLNQEFGAWDATGSVAQTNSLDLATLFMSTMLHVHLHIENKELVPPGEEASNELLSENNYESSSKSIKVGDADTNLPIGAIDIAGLNYDQYEAGELNAPTSHAASSTTIPYLMASFEASGSQTYEQEDESIGVISGVLSVDFSVLMYAVSYSTFDGSGDQIIHDPTFSVFIDFSSPGVLAWILVIGIVTLVGVAAVIITKKKNASFEKLK